MAENNQLDFGGIYIVKTKDFKFLITTYLGYNDVFGKDPNLKYKKHSPIVIDRNVYDNLEEQYF